MPRSTATVIPTAATHRSRRSKPNPSSTPDQPSSTDDQLKNVLYRFVALIAAIAIIGFLIWIRWNETGVQPQAASAAQDTAPIAGDETGVQPQAASAAQDTAPFAWMNDLEWPVYDKTQEKIVREKGKGKGNDVLLGPS